MLCLRSHGPPVNTETVKGQNDFNFRSKHSVMLATEPVDEGRAKMSESKNEVIKFDVVVVGSCMTDLVR